MIWHYDNNLDWSRQVEYLTRQDLIRVRILDLSIWVKSENSTQVFKSSQKIEIKYRLEILDSTHQDMKRSTTNIYLSVW